MSKYIDLVVQSLFLPKSSSARPSYLSHFDADSLANPLALSDDKSELKILPKSEIFAIGLTLEELLQLGSDY